MVEPGTLREPGRATGPDDRDGVGLLGADPPTFGIARLVVGETVVDRVRRHTQRFDVGDLRRAEPGVDPGGDGAEADRRLVGDRVVDPAGEADRDDVAAADAALGENGGETVGVRRPLGEREAACSTHPRIVAGAVSGLDERLAVGVGREDLVVEVEQGGHQGSLSELLRSCRLRRT